MAMENPYKVGPTFKNSFNVESDGLVQGDAHDDPYIRMQLASGVIADDVSGSLWGGMGIIESIPVAGQNQLGSVLRPATADSCNAFLVFNQAGHGVVTPDNSVPQFMAGNTAHYYRLGSCARIPLPVSAAVAALADGTSATDGVKFSWDPVNNCIDVAASDGIALRLLKVSPKGNLVAVKDATSGDVNWDDKPVGLFAI